MTEPSHLKIEATSDKKKFKLFLLVPEKDEVNRLYFEFRHATPANYQFSVNVTPMKEIDQEPNNAFDLAQLVEPNFNLAKGLFTWNDPYDYYQFTATKAGSVQINLKMAMENIFFTMYNDQKKVVVKEQYITKKTDTKSGLWSTKLNVKAGTYYIKLERDFYRTGTYQLAILAPQMLVAPTAEATSTRVKGTTYANCKITVKIGDKKYTGKSKDTGAFSIKIPKQAKEQVISVTATTQAGTTKTTKIEVH